MNYRFVSEVSHFSTSGFHVSTFTRLFEIIQIDHWLVGLFYIIYKNRKCTQLCEQN